MKVKWKRVRVGNELFSIEILDGVFSKVECDESGPIDTVEYDGAGMLYLPTFSDMHCHLDKHFIGEQVWHSRQTIDTLPNQLKREKGFLQSLEQSVKNRARNMLDIMLNNGTTQIRTHVDIDPEIGLQHLEAVVQVREEYRGLVDIEIVAFPQQGFIRSDAQTLMRKALQSGADIVGAVDPGGLDRAVEPCLEQLFNLAVEYDAGIDIHLHDPGHLGVYTMLQDNEKNELLRTLKVFYDSQCQLVDSAKRLFIHRNTLVYRLEKCEKLIGVKLKDPMHSLRFRVAFAIEPFLKGREDMVNNDALSISEELSPS